MVHLCSWNGHCESFPEDRRLFRLDSIQWSGLHGPWVKLFRSRTSMAAWPKKWLQLVTHYSCLGDGFRYFVFSPLFGEDSHFDQYFSNGLNPPTSHVIISQSYLFGHFKWIFRMWPTLTLVVVFCCFLYIIPTLIGWFGNQPKSTTRRRPLDPNLLSMTCRMATERVTQKIWALVYSPFWLRDLVVGKVTSFCWSSCQYTVCSPCSLL